MHRAKHAYPECWTLCSSPEVGACSPRRGAIVVLHQKNNRSSPLTRPEFNLQIALREVKAILPKATLRNMNHDDLWPFDQPRNCATVTSKGIMLEGESVVRVYHDEEDHGWQFHPAEGIPMDVAMRVTLESVVKLDPALLHVADLPPGWFAEREHAGAPWIRHRHE